MADVVTAAVYASLQDIFARARRDAPEFPRTTAVAVSGGLDSTVLACVAAELLAGPSPSAAAQGEWLPAGRLRLVHVNHGLSDSAEVFEARCRRLAETLGVPLDVLPVAVPRRPRLSVEASAREVRYGALRAWLVENGVLLTAHHLDDQAETVLLHLLRGSGCHGLKGIVAQQRFGAGILGRPLLAVARNDLLAFARRRNLTWVDDPMNRDPARDRNHVRHAVLPVLEARWPGAVRAIARAASLQEAFAGVLTSRAAAMLARTARDDGRLCVHGLRGLTDFDQCELVRHWLRDEGLEVTSASLLERTIALGGPGRVPGAPAVAAGAHTIRRYREWLYLLPADLPEPPFTPRRWDGLTSLELPLGTLEASDQAGSIVGVEKLPRDGFEVTFRQGGERVRLKPDGYHKPLKKIFQDAGIPPWERTRYPLLRLGGEIVVIPGVHVAPELAPHRASEPFVGIVWARSFRRPD